MVRPNVIHRGRRRSAVKPARVPGVIDSTGRSRKDRYQKEEQQP